MLLPFSWHKISWNFCRMLRVGCCVKNNHARGLKIFIQGVLLLGCTTIARYAIHWIELYINNNVTFT